MTARALDTALDVIVLNWNGADFCRALFASLEPIARDGALPMRVLMVDNGSSDDSCAMVEQAFPWVHILRLPENLGYAAGNNAGIRATSAPYVMLLNNDTEIIQADFFERLAAVLDHNPKIAMVGPTLVTPSGALQRGGGGYDLTIRTALGHFLFLSVLFPRWLPPYYLDPDHYTQEEGVVHLQWISGAAPLLRRSVLEQVGGIPEQFFMYSEDVLLSRVIRKAGYKLAYLPSARIKHIHGATENATGIKTRWIDSALTDYASRGSPAKTLLLQGIMALGFLGRAVAYGLRGLLGRSGDRLRARKMWVYMKASAAFRERT